MNENLWLKHRLESCKDIILNSKFYIDSELNLYLDNYLDRAAPVSEFYIDIKHLIKHETKFLDEMVEFTDKLQEIINKIEKEIEI